MKFSSVNLGMFSAGLLLSVGLATASNVSVDIGDEHQVIRGFGGMVHNTWQGGGGLSEADADLAFGTGEGQIGLTVLRIPVNKNSSDFGKELNAAKYAKARGAIVYATPWDSPYAGGGQHISSSNYQKYTDHLNSFAEYMKNQGVPLYAISIQNEPDWCNEWTCWSADEHYNYTRDFADQLRKHGTKVISAESFAYQKSLYDKILNDNNVLKNIDILGAHFYAMVASTGDNFFQYPLADQKNVERWMTEHYTESQGSGNYWRHVMVTGDQATAAKLDTVRAMDVAYEIHRGLAVGNFSQYTWWYIRRCYGLIMERDFGNKLSIPQNEIGKVSKRGYLMAQYARFIRPGAVRIGATEKPEKELYVSAYKNADSVMIVLVNRDINNTKTVNFDIPGVAAKTTWTKYVTSETKNVKNEGEVVAENGKFSVTLDKECVMTLVAPNAFGPPVPREPFNGTIAEIPGTIEAENYDISGSMDRSFKDSDTENQGGEYREDGVDIVSGGDNYALGYTATGEWTEYTVNVAEAGEYDLYANLASGSETSSIQFSLGEKTLTAVYTVPQTDTETWDVYEMQKIGTVALEKGEQIIRLNITGSYVNIDWFKFVKAGDIIDNIKPLQLNIVKESLYEVFDVKGNRIAEFNAKSMNSAKEIAKALNKPQGLYMIRSKASGKIASLNLTK